jgi:hypothetical protein
MERMQELIAGFSKEYKHIRYAIGLNAYGGELINYACEIGKVDEALNKAKMSLARILDTITPKPQ